MTFVINWARTGLFQWECGSISGQVKVSSMAAVMLIFWVLLACQILPGLKCENTTHLPWRMGLDADGKVIEAGTRIIGGETVHIKAYPYAVSIQWRSTNVHHCGGSYIKPRFVLSAAHCMVIKSADGSWQARDPKLFSIMAGTANLKYSPTWQISVPDRIIPHSNYYPNSMNNDIGLYRLSKPFRITPYVNYAPLPNYPDPFLYSRNRIACTVVGWGTTSVSSTETSDYLHHAKVPLVENCAALFGSAVLHTQICAGRMEGGVDSCQGDSGGPLLCSGKQVGIVSWGYGCAAPRSPGVYVRVDKYLNWISSNTYMRSNALPSKILSINTWICVIYSTIITHL